MANSALLSQLVDAFQCLPGVGAKSAQRMAYHLLDKQRQKGARLAQLITESMQIIRHCQFCRDYTEQETCIICLNSQRDSRLLCVVESPSDVAAVESTANYSGKYFVLLGHISPLDGIGPQELGMDLLQLQLQKGDIEEVIIATSSTIEGDATANYIQHLSQNINNDIHVSRLAQGVPVGGELGYLDTSTLSLSLANRNRL
ncbi:MAG: recombination mediator RecR [Enterobacterales bacterium]|nr:recombination mediator RecR [Enterobacterales bacterium]